MDRNKFKIIQSEILWILDRKGQDNFSHEDMREVAYNIRENVALTFFEGLVPQEVIYKVYCLIQDNRKQSSLGKARILFDLKRSILSKFEDDIIFRSINEED